MSSTYCKKISPSRIRKVVESDRLNIYCQLIKARDAVAGQEITIKNDVQHTTNQIMIGAIDSYILDEAYLVAYYVGSPWYSHRIFVEECLVLRIGKGSSFDSVCDLLDDIADEHDAEIIFVAGALAKHKRALVKKYKSYGYVESPTPSLFKRRK